MSIETPNLAQPETQHKLEDNLEVIFWKETSYEDEKSDLEIKSVKNKEPGDCNMSKTTPLDTEDYLCMTNVGDSCTDPSAEEMPKKGIARVLVSTDSRDRTGSGWNKFDLIFGFEAKISKPCNSNESQEALYIPVSNYTEWIQDEVRTTLGHCLVDKPCHVRSMIFRIQVDVLNLFYWMKNYYSDAAWIFLATTILRRYLLRPLLQNLKRSQTTPSVRRLPLRQMGVYL